MRDFFYFCPKLGHADFAQKKSRLEIIEQSTSLGGPFSKYTEKPRKKKRGSQKHDSNSPKPKNFASKLFRNVQGVSRTLFHVFRNFGPLVAYLAIFLAYFQACPNFDQKKKAYQRISAIKNVKIRDWTPKRYHMIRNGPNFEMWPKNPKSVQNLDF